MNSGSPCDSPLCTALQFVGSAQFDATWYLHRYPDVSATGLAPEVHYRKFGYRIGRDPYPGISTEFLRATFALPKRAEPIEAAASGRYAFRYNRVIPAAARLNRQGRPRLAADLARRFLIGEFACVAHVFAANALVMPDLDAPDLAVGSLASAATRASWCTEVNAWLDGHGLSPITLSDSAEKRFLPTCLGGTISAENIAAGPLVSVIMTCHNDAATVIDAARSILGQSWRKLELLVVDDASTDGTMDSLTALAATDGRVRLWRNTSKAGPFVSYNIAVTQMRGAYLTLHGARDWAHPDRIARQIGFMMEGDQVASLVSSIRVDSGGRFWQPEEVYQPSRSADVAPENGIPMIQATVFHQSLGFWDSVQQGADQEMIARLRHLTDDLPTLRLPLIFRHDPGHPAHQFEAGSDPDQETLNAYRTAYEAFHRRLNPTTARVNFPAERRFGMPDQFYDRLDRIAAVIEDHLARGMRLTRDIDVDVAIVTNLRFPGGNASSTLDELRVLRQHGLRCALIHCPVDLPVIRATSERYREHDDIIVDWSRVGQLRARCLIIRHPRVVVSTMFQRIVKRLSADFGFVVVNNSIFRSNGRSVYDIATFSSVTQQLPVKHLEICPISAVLRAELLTHDRPKPKTAMPLSGEDWTPTLNPEAYVLEPKRHMTPPFVIGRHGRDGDEKWHENSVVLAKAYPDTPDIRVSILGGADVARKRMGRLPANWTVHEFGNIEPKDYLAELDVFVYYPQSTLVEGFGRTIGEAMMAGVPCLVSPSLESNFGPLAFYARPGVVQPLISALARDDAGRLAFLREVQNIAIARFSSDAIVRRLAVTGLFEATESAPRTQLSSTALAWRNHIHAMAEREAENSGMV